MCYHISEVEGSAELQKEFDRKMRYEEVFKSAYHVSGFTRPMIPVISIDDPGVIDLFRWTLIPPNVKDESEFVKKWNTLNAKSEEIWDSPLYSQFTGNRCVVICTGYFEPHTSFKQKTHSYFIKSKNDSVLTLAGLYSKRNDMPTFTILTTIASPLLGKIHNDGLRQPLTLRRELIDSWLDPNLSKKDMIEIMKTYPGDENLVSYRVMDGVLDRNIDTNVPEVLLPFDGSAGEQIPLF